MAHMALDDFLDKGQANASSFLVVIILSEAPENAENLTLKLRGYADAIILNVKHVVFDAVRGARRSQKPNFN
jgi:hypothetical protein